MTVGPTPFTWLARILEEEEVASVKDSITSRLPARGQGEGVEASGSSGHTAIAKFKFGKSYMAEDEVTEDVKKMAFVP